jgi:hypothetical protein
MAVCGVCYFSPQHFPGYRRQIAFAEEQVSTQHANGVTLGPAETGMRQLACKLMWIRIAATAFGMAGLVARKTLRDPTVAPVILSRASNSEASPGYVARAPSPP